MGDSWICLVMRDYFQLLRNYVCRKTYGRTCFEKLPPRASSIRNEIHAEHDVYSCESANERRAIVAHSSDALITIHFDS